MNKLKSRRGETLTETLVAVLVIALSAALLCTMVTTASRLSLAARSNDAAFYSDLSTAETDAETTGEAEKGTVKVTVNGTTTTAPPQSINVNIYGDGVLRAYRIEVAK